MARLSRSVPKSGAYGIGAHVAEMLNDQTWRLSCVLLSFPAYTCFFRVPFQSIIMAIDKGVLGGVEVPQILGNLDLA